jgi:two-component system LytT family response regulator
MALLTSVGDEFAKKNKKMHIFSKNTALAMLRTIIIDDEAHQRLTIEKMVKAFCPNLIVVAQAGGVRSGVKAIRKHRPDLVLLDIKLDDGTGFDLLEELSPVDFKVIFITAYDHYAVRAFRFSALDYLLKPLDPEELVQAVAKTGTVLQKDFNTQLANMKHQLGSVETGRDKIIIRTFDSIHLVPLHEILYCESDHSCVIIHLINHTSITASASLKDYEEILAESGFFRVHKTYLVNVKYIRRFEKAEGGFVVLEGEIKIPVASRKRDELLEIFGQLLNT